MTIRKVHAAKRKIQRMISNYYGLLVNTQQIQRPIFILGCGRSGTTILGRVLSHHSRITYLNERRDLWKLAYPATDIWSPQAKNNRAKLMLTSKDTSIKQNNKLRRLFMWQTLCSQKPILIEKLPINNFRISFLHHIFPEASYIHIRRNGIEVAKSMERETNWFSKFDYRWELLTEIAKEMDISPDILRQCTGNYEKGLLEWHLSLNALDLEKEKISPRLHEITYDKLVDTPRHTIRNILEFLGLSQETAILEFAENNIARRNPAITRAYTEPERLLGGDQLKNWYDFKKDV